MAEESIHVGPGDVRSMEAFNEEHVSSLEMLESLKFNHSNFKGDWVALETLILNLEKNAKEDYELPPYRRLDPFNDFVKILVLTKVHLEGAILVGAHLEGANLENAFLADVASLSRASLDQANLRVKDHVPFDNNQVHRAIIPGNARDEWSVLRRHYSGPRFFVTLILLIGFLLPQIGMALFYSGHDATVTFAEEQYRKIYPTLNNLSQSHPDGLMLKKATDRLKLTTIKIERAYHKRYQKWPAIALVLGMHHGWLSMLLAVIILPYNYLRARLTLKVGELRDQEERSQVTPARDEYMTLYGQKWYLGHRLLNKLLWIAAISSVVNVLHWALTAKVLVSI